MATRTFSKLSGYSIESEIDRKLLQGIFEALKPISKASQRFPNNLADRKGMISTNGGKVI